MTGACVSPRRDPTRTRTGGCGFSAVPTGGDADVAPVAGADDTGVNYAVLWSKDDGPTMAGKLELLGDVIQLDGRNGRVVRLSLPLEAIASARIGRALVERLHGRPVLMLDVRGGGQIRVATLAGAGALHELADSLGAR